MSSSALAASPDIGRRLIPQIVDSLASTDPERIFYSITSLDEASLSFRHITARQFADAVDKTAWWLIDQLGTPGSIEPVGYIGQHDIRHILLTYACVKAGYSALFLSPKNNLDGALAVLDVARCNIWVQSKEQSSVPLVKEFLERREMRLLQLPEVDELINAASNKPFPYTKMFDDVAHEPFCILHTSGTTGVPKPVSWSHGLIGTMDAIRLLPSTEGDDGLAPWSDNWNEGDTIYSSFPMSHGAGIIMDILLPALFALHCILGPAKVIPNMHLMDLLATQAKIDIWSMVPSLVDELSETPDVLEKFRSSKFICASGGPVNPALVTKVNSTVRVLNLTGTTEGLFIGNLWTEREEWHWFAFHPYSGFEFKEIEPGVYEQWAHRNEHWPLFQGIFHTFPSENHYNFKDLYVRHPTKPNLWAFRGRSNDTVVLSSGEKISPLDTEAYVTTHPAIEGCLMIGSGKLQPGLLIELKNPSKADDEVLDSIWSTIEESNEQGLQRIRLSRDFITFAEPGRPFIRTDKGTVKRQATLTLYADYIERFYSSRGDDLGDFNIDTTTVESTTKSVRQILGSILPAILEAGPDDDVFGLGLDSLNVFKAIKIIQVGMKLQGQIAPRHLYANPNLGKFSTFLFHKISEIRQTDGFVKKESTASTMKKFIDHHKARQSFRLNPLDYVNPLHYMGLSFFFSLPEGTHFKETFTILQKGLRRTFEIIPALEGKIMACSEQEIGYAKGDLCVTIPPLRSSVVSDTQEKSPRQLIYRDLSNDLPSFSELKYKGFVPSAIDDSLILSDVTFPELPADILVAQANFIEGGCILATNFNHCCLDGVGVMVALQVWAESCRYVQGDETATCGWFDAESFNHSLPEIIYEQEGYAKPVEQVDPGVWGFLPFVAPDDVLESSTNRTTNGDHTNGKKLPFPPPLPLRSKWPLDPNLKPMKTTQFLIPPENLEKLKQEVLTDPGAKGVITSISDIVQAFFWRAAIRARYHVATQLRGESFGPEDLSILETPIDGRPYFSSLLPSTYMGSMLLMNRATMPVEMLCSPKTTIGQVAYLLREAAARITPRLVHDAFTILKSLPDHTRFSTANMGLDHMHAMISNLMLFQTNVISFGDGIFADGGSPLAMRPLIDRGNARFRFLVVFPMREDGGVELVFGTRAEELEMFLNDAEFTRYAKLVDTC
ncbi:transferase family protein-like protein [Plenodomus tracheiphilus IPT5]|uniref:Transferase family protein-like protein n=1 Tax=Plenodomus tracheiphilus IPT5 TaxID=1408161 RepID=A0A6A7ASS5_9PLEO|nr:transferase family protein-like protein [Plenodomus tracheiphilus IPT5]